MKKKYIIIILILALVFTVLGSTIAYLQWQSSSANATNVVFTVQPG